MAGNGSQMIRNITKKGFQRIEPNLGPYPDAPLQTQTQTQACGGDGGGGWTAAAAGGELMPSELYHQGAIPFI